ncbi:MAG: AAA family ATPase [Faecalicoccus sp.]|uniref:AAA family ATPase n=1 Tax=Faecalicoccus sp. TaxID=1971758 RepID=UPI002F947812
MGVYKIKKGFFGMSLIKALENASLDDVFVLEENYCENIGKVTIRQDITIIGTPASIPGEEQQRLTNTLTGQIFVADGANVTLQNLTLNHLQRVSGTQSNAINVKQSTLRFDHCILISDVPASNYPLLYIENSDLEMLHSKFKSNGQGDIEFYIPNSNFEISNSILENIRIHSLNSNGIMMDTSMENDYNCVHAVDSTLEIYNSTLNGKTIVTEEGTAYPTVMLDHVELTSENSAYYQEVVSKNSLYAKNNSIFRSVNDSIKWIGLFDSKAYFNDTVIQGQLHMHRSYAYAQNLTFQDAVEDYYYLFAEDYSTVYGSRIHFSDHAYTLFKMSSYSSFVIDEVDLPQQYENVHRCDENSRVCEFVTESKTENQKEVVSSVSAYKKLQSLVGLTRIKDEVENIRKLVGFNESRKKEGKKVQELSLHSVFMGNPGTGKTMVARLIGQIIYELGVFHSDEYKFVEVKESDLISNHVGETAIQTQNILQSALGGVLFIDEAYTLNKKDASVNFGQEAVDTILTFMEEHRDNIMIIFAGYPKEMEEFLQMNSGLASRIANTFIFDDYTSEEIVQIGLNDLSQRDFLLEDESYYIQKVKQAYERALERSNGRWIRNFNEGLIKMFISNSSDNVTTITALDIDNYLNKDQKYRQSDNEAYQKLQDLIGIHTVKKQVDAFIAQVEYNRQRMEQGFKADDITLHSLFLGNPGTGKTTVARLLGNILYHKGITKTNSFVETSRSDLVAGYVGQTAIKTKAILQSALGGILFIDEAYTLYQGDNDSFGQEAIDTILKFMEDYRKDIVIIFAGYTKEMNDFLQSNSGLRSRIPFTFNFEDYTMDELVQIGLLDLHKKEYVVDEALYKRYLSDAYTSQNDDSNGRFVRNFNEKMILNLSVRVSKNPNVDISQILEEDFPNAELHSVGNCPYCHDEIVVKHRKDGGLYYVHKMKKDCNFKLYEHMKRYKDNQDDIYVGENEAKALLRNESIKATLESKNGTMFRALVRVKESPKGYCDFEIVDFLNE